MALLPITTNSPIRESELRYCITNQVWWRVPSCWKYLW